jgi:hypothetical protein
MSNVPTLDVHADIVNTPRFSLQGLAIIVVMLFQTGSIMYWAGNVSARLSSVERAVDTRNTAQDIRIDKLASDVNEIRRDVDRGITRAN